MKTTVHLVSADEAEQETALNIAGNLMDDDSIDDVVVVAQAKGIQAVSADGDLHEKVGELLNDGVSFRGCETTMELMGMDASDLVDGVETVPSGAVEVTRLQEEGYGYLRP